MPSDPACYACYGSLSVKRISIFTPRGLVDQSSRVLVRARHTAYDQRGATVPTAASRRSKQRSSNFWPHTTTIPRRSCGRSRPTTSSQGSPASRRGRARSSSARIVVRRPHQRHRVASRSAYGALETVTIAQSCAFHMFSASLSAVSRTTSPEHNRLRYPPHQPVSRHSQLSTTTPSSRRNRGSILERYQDTSVVRASNVSRLIVAQNTT